MDTISTEETGGRICLGCGLQFDSHARFCSQCGGGLVERLEDPLLGKVWGDRYEILEVVGKGGMGIVYKARHKLLDRLVAIKTLHPSMVSNHQNLARFHREAKAASSLNHAHIISVHDFGMSPHGVPYLVMDYLDGQSLACVIEKQGFLAPERALPIFIQVCEALNHAHKRGVVHRDLKPTNIMLVETDDEVDSARLLDFGLAKLLAQPGKLLERLSSTNEAFGSPLYMSPEQCMGQELDQRADLYALGCVMYETLTGSPPLKDDNALGTIYKQINEIPAALGAQRPDLAFSRELEAIVMKALEKNPERRYASALDVRSDLWKELSSLKSEGPADTVQVADLAAGLEVRAQPEEVLPEVVDYEALPPAEPDMLSSEQSMGDWSSSPDGQRNSRWQAGDQSYKSDIDAQQEQQYLLQLKNEELAFGSQSKGLLEILKGLADLYNRQRRFAEARSLYERLAQLIAKWRGLKSADMHDAWLNLGDMCIELQQYDQAKIHYEAAHTAVRECYGEEHPEVARVLRSLAYLSRTFDNSTAAIDYLNRALAVLDKCFGPSNPMLADTLGRLAFIYYLDERDFAEAHRLYDRAISITEAASGQDDLDLAKHFLGKADVYIEECRYDEAREYCLKARAIQERLYGPIHATIANTLDRLAWMYYLQADYAAAVEHYTQELQMQEKLEDLEGVVTTLLNLAFACRQADGVAAAEQHCRRAIEICDRLYGHEHVETSRALMELGFTYRDQGRFAEAVEVYEETLRIREAAWGGRNHSSVADTLEALAWLKNDMGRLEEAKKHCLEAIEIVESMPYVRKFTLVSRLKWLSGLCETMGDEKEAKRYLERAEQFERVGADEVTGEKASFTGTGSKVCKTCGLRFDGSAGHCDKCQGELTGADVLMEQRYVWQLENEERILGPDSEGLIEIMANLARLYREQGRHSEAKPLYERLIALIPQWEQLDSTHLYDVYCDLVHACYELQQYDEAHEYANTVLPMAERIYGKDQPEVALVFQLLGNIALAKGDAAGARTYYTHVVRISEECFGKDNPSIPVALTQLSEACCELGDFDEADELIDRALAGVRNNGDNADVAKVLKCKADMAWKRKDYEKARQTLEEVLKCQRATFGLQHIEIAQSLDTLAWMSVMLEDYASAEQTAREVLSMRESLGDTDSPELVDAIVTLGDICRYADKLDDAEQQYKRALQLSEHVFGANHPKTAHAVLAMGRLCISKERFGEAEKLFRRSLSIRQTIYGPFHPQVAEAIEELAMLFEKSGNYPAAEKSYLQAIEIMERDPYPDKFTLRFMYKGLSDVYRKMGDQSKADRASKRAEELDRTG